MGCFQVWFLVLRVDKVVYVKWMLLLLLMKLMLMRNYSLRENSLFLNKISPQPSILISTIWKTFHLDLPAQNPNPDVMVAFYPLGNLRTHPHPIKDSRNSFIMANTPQKLTFQENCFSLLATKLLPFVEDHKTNDPQFFRAAMLGWC